jgi:nucleotide-binding universal stress UspA family protein
MTKPVRKNNFKPSKKQIQKILVPLDGSKNSLRGLDTAIEIARTSKGIITVVFVVPVVLTSSFQPIDHSPEIIRKYGEEILKSAKTRAARKGVLMNSKILCGDAGNMITRYANLKNNRISLIVIGSRGNSGLKELFLGSTSTYVVHKSKIPVLVVK